MHHPKRWDLLQSFNKGSELPEGNSPALSDLDCLQIALINESIQLCSTQGKEFRCLFYRVHEFIELTIDFHASLTVVVRLEKSVTITNLMPDRSVWREMTESCRRQLFLSILNFSLGFASPQSPSKCFVTACQPSVELRHFASIRTWPTSTFTNSSKGSSSLSRVPQCLEG